MAQKPNKKRPSKTWVKRIDAERLAIASNNEHNDENPAVASNASDKRPDRQPTVVAPRKTPRTWIKRPNNELHVVDSAAKHPQTTAISSKTWVKRPAKTWIKHYPTTVDSDTQIERPNQHPYSRRTWVCLLYTSPSPRDRG